MFRISLIAVFVAFFGFTSASVDQCWGKCPNGYPNGTAVLLPHEECGKYCSCVYGRPVEMPCPPGLHYSEKDHVCTDPYLANCVRPAMLVSEQISSSAEQKVVEYAEESDTEDECIGACPDGLIEYPEVTVILAHKKCHKFCKCNSNGTLVQSCPKHLHFSLKFGGCTTPVEANCQRIIEYESFKSPPHDCCECPTPTPIPTVSPTPGDPSGCIGTCPVWGGDEVVHLPHKDCTQFCKCDFGTPNVISCPNGLHFNPIVQICDRPSEAGCAGDGTTPSHPTGPTTTPGPGGHPSGCQGACPTWEGNNVVHLPHRDCTQFCKCDFGIPHVMTCPSGLHFNPILQVCDRPSHAGCGSDGTTPPQPPGTITTAVPRPTTTNRPRPTKPTPFPTSQSPIPTGNPSGCIGACPTWEGNNVVHLPHRDCTQFCKCDFGIPHVMTCPSGLHFNPILQVCDRPSHAGCGSDGTTPPQPPGTITTAVPRPTTTNRPRPTKPTPFPTSQSPIPTGNPSGCIGACPTWEGNNVVHLPHRDCTQFCKCDFGIPHVMTCPSGLHFNPILQVCDRPSHAGCGSDGTTPPQPPGTITTAVPRPTTTNRPRPTKPTPFPTSQSPIPTSDPSGCIGACPTWEGNNVVHLPHRDCTQFCKCDFGIPHVMTCPSGLHFNPILQVCDRPSHAGCGSDGTTPPQPPGTITTAVPRPTTTNRPRPTKPTPFPTSQSPIPTGNPSGCIGACPTWEGNNVVHLPYRDCTQFCKCDFGAPHVMSCPNGLHFNPILEVCDRPSAAGCTPGSNPTSPRPPGPSTAPPSGGDSAGCIGTCPPWEGADVVHLPHRDCTQFCKCDFGIPHVMTCPNGLHFNPILEVCDRPSEAGCKSGYTRPNPSVHSTPSSGPPLPPPPSTPGGPSGCKGTCPQWEGDKVVHLPHKDCTKFCKCDFGIAHVMTCPNGLHFNPILQVCDRPGGAGCTGGNPIPSPSESPKPEPEPTPSPEPIPTPTQSPAPEDTSGCIGTCPHWEGDKVVHLPHIDCTKFCKCDFGKPKLISCQTGLHFNPTLEVCDRPGHAGCTGIGGSQNRDGVNDIARKNIMGFNRLFRW